MLGGSNLHCPQAASVNGQCWHVVKQHFLHKTTGHQAFAGFAGSPQQIDMRQLNGILPSLPRHAIEGLARMQTQQFTLGGRPPACGIGRNLQTYFVTTWKHHCLHGPAKQLRQRQNNYLLVCWMDRRIGFAFKRLVYPAGKSWQFQGRRQLELSLGTLLQPEHIQHCFTR